MYIGKYSKSSEVGVSKFWFFAYVHLHVHLHVHLLSLIEKQTKPLLGKTRGKTSGAEISVHKCTLVYIFKEKVYIDSKDDIRNK